MAEVSWSNEAILQLDQIVDYLDQFDPRAAARIQSDLFAAGEGASYLSQSGATGGRREIVRIWPYILTYRVDGDRVTIVEIRHGAQQTDFLK